MPPKPPHPPRRFSLENPKTKPKPHPTLYKTSQRAPALGSRGIPPRPPRITPQNPEKRALCPIISNLGAVAVGFRPRGLKMDLKLDPRLTTKAHRPANWANCKQVGSQSLRLSLSLRGLGLFYWKSFKGLKGLGQLGSWRRQNRRSQS